MKVFLDANIIIDVVQNRTDFVEQSSKILQSGLEGLIDLCASDVTFTTVSFYARKQRTTEQLYEIMQSLRDFIDVAPTGKIAIDWALQRKAKDFEDSVQYYVALRTGADYIVSRNVRDYPFDDIPVVTPQDFFSIMGFE